MAAMLRNRCVHCGRSLPQPAVGPFCSARCQAADLQAWFLGRHAIPGAPVEVETDPAALISRPAPVPAPPIRIPS